MKKKFTNDLKIKMEKKQKTKKQKRRKKKKNFHQISSIKWNHFPRKSQEEKSNDYKFTLP